MMYDYIIVGAGSAGCVLAGRLTEDPKVSVLLLEAGGPDDAQEIHIPATFSRLFKTPVDWDYATEEEPRLNGRAQYWPRGKVLGGSSSINIMIYMRGNRADYDRWQALGNDGWGYADVLPYFKKAEDQGRGASAYHGAGGPLHVMDRPYTNALSHAFIEAGAELGWPRNDDFNGASQEGVGAYQVTQRQGRRESAADAYLRPALGRPNLTVLTWALATRVLFEGSRAVGVAYLKDGQEQQVRANGEVLLCGGTINSPQVLMLSGVGPAEHLRSLGIGVRVDLPGVGGNLQDHVCTGVFYGSKQPISLFGVDTADNLREYVEHQRGPLTSNGAEAGAFVRTQPDLPEPDLQYLFIPTLFLNNGLTPPDRHGYTIVPAVVTPRSRGHLTLRSADPTRRPAIYSNYLAEESDLAALTEGVKIARRLGETRAFAPFADGELTPGLGVQGDQEIADYLRNSVQSLYHPVGTCKMGRDAQAVVDEQLRVRGTDALRVVDASIMPTIVNGNTNAPTIMIAEKVAALLRGQPVRGEAMDYAAVR